MMLASGQVCYGCSKAGTSPLWFGVTLTVRSDRGAPKRQRTTRATRRCVASFLVSLFGAQASTSCGAADLSGMLQNLNLPPRPPRVAAELLFNDGDLRPDPV